MLLANQYFSKEKKHQELERRLLSLFINPQNIHDTIQKLSIILEEMKKINGIDEEIDVKHLQPVSDETLLNNFHKYQEEIVNICEAKTVPVIDMNVFANFAESFGKYFSQPVDKISHNHLEGQIGIFSSTGEEIPITFTSGKKTIITPHNFNLSVFTKDELIELLRVLDVTVKDNSYDYLRSEIIDQLNSISNITRS